jgi:uncharacterized protein YjbI with pentapeptide repeats
VKVKRPISVKPPVLPAEGTVANSVQIVLNDEAEYANFVLSQVGLIGQEARFVALETALLTQVRFNGSKLTKLRLSDVRFDRCDLSNTEWTEGKISRAEMFDCKLTGFRLIEADASNCLFLNGVGELVQFHGTRFKSTVFENCLLRGADFRFCDLTGATFIGCDLRDAEFYDAKLEDADFRGSELQGIKTRPENLKGMIISSQQAFDLGRHLAVLLGVEVRDN